MPARKVPASLLSCAVPVLSACFAVLVLSACEEGESIFDSSDNYGPDTLSIDQLEVDEAQLRLHIRAAFGTLAGVPSKTVTVGGHQVLVLSSQANEIVTEIPAGGAGSFGDVVVKVPNGRTYAGRLYTFTGTVESRFNKDGITSTGRFRLKFRGSLFQPPGKRLTMSAMRESALESWDVGGSNSVVASRQKTCPGTAPWFPAGTGYSGSGFSASLELFEPDMANFFGSATIVGCVRESFRDGSQATTGVGWPFVSLTRSWASSSGTIPGGTSSTADYSTTWSSFVIQPPVSP